MFKEVSSKTDFPQLEKEILKSWQEKKIVAKYLEKNKNSEKHFSFIDGPITANNPMGVHHAWGRTYKDLWQRFYNLKGFKQRFQNGFDEQGLWVEVEVEKELGLHTKKDIENLVAGNVFESIAKFVNLCKERVKKFSAVQTEQSQRLGYFMDWEHSYHTSSEENNYAIWHYLKKIQEKDWLYKGHDTVPWCPRCGTAISQHEILTEEYKEVVHKSVFFKLPLKTKENEYLLVWTTTPWTIPGNVSVAVNPKSTYQLIVHDEEKYWVMKERVKEVFGKSSKVEKSLKGKELLGWEYSGPFDSLEKVKQASSEGNFHKIIAAEDLVTAEEGTGLVHIAPAAGEEDFKLSKELKLPVVELIDEGANYIEGLGEFSGQNAKKHPELIIDYLEKKENGKFLFKTENYKHRYPTCWRCKTELVWRVVDEWYIAMDKEDKSESKGKTYRESMLAVIKDANWIPKWGYERELDWLNNLHDWLISKKRYWGLALPIWECQNCGNFDVIGSKEELKEKAVEGWADFEGNSPHRPWIDKVKIKCSKCASVTSRIPDVGNPWLDAGIVPYSTLNYFEDKKYWEEWFPADFITESFPGQFKNWFYSLIAMSTALENKIPFKTLLGHGSVRDEKGEEMHKSKGNAIWFDEAAEKMGVDVMRWLYLKSNPENNVNFGYAVADETRRYFHIRLWNVYSFLVNYALIDGWTPKKAPFEPKNSADRWLLSRLSGIILNVEVALEKYQPNEAISLAEKFVVDDLSNWYVRRIRNRVGPTVEKSSDKEQAYQTLWVTLVELSKTLSPMIPFMSEAIYQNLTQEESVHLTNWPKTEYLIDEKLEEQMSRAIEISSEIHALRKEKNIKVRQPLARASYSGETLPEEIELLIAEELNVKKVENKKDLKNSFELDTTVTPELKIEGEVRDLIRAIQEARKEAGCRLDEIVSVSLPSWPESFTEEIKKQTLAKELSRAASVQIKRG
ncbi:MAG TPA: isoleucine--tRNA ligase [Candidatus Saccharimonadales bacterium]|nr:isoleucine--tRNA ligase [Candidatus Saccharimonadales bacterium]